jgi:hypothetical protein
VVCRSDRVSDDQQRSACRHRGGKPTSLHMERSPSGAGLTRSRPSWCDCADVATQLCAWKKIHKHARLMIYVLGPRYFL